MLTITIALIVAAFICTIASAINKCPLWVPVLLVIIVEALQHIPK